MPSETLNITLVQPDMVWEDKEANLAQYEAYISNTKSRREVVLLPEMFSTGFVMQPEHLAEPMDGPTVKWMKHMAAKYRCILAGSLIIHEEGQYYNRLLWMQPNGEYGIYDKRHLFGYAGEDEHYNPGEKRLIVSVNGWRICPLICYDLRFPVWSRNQNDEFDILVYVANWPVKRILAWKTLLQARAIENQSYVIGVNRVGQDGYGIEYNGSSSAFDPIGAPVIQLENAPVSHTITLSMELLTKTRTELPFLEDADKFLLI